VKGKKERIGRILQMHANSRDEIKEVRAGDIAAAVGLKDVTTGDTLCAPDHVITLERMEFPEPVISVAVEPKTKVDQEKMGVALQKLAKEDPSFRVHTDEETGQTIISGMGELHLDIIVDRMKREFAVEANVVPREYISSVDKGVQEQMLNGVVGGYPVVDVKVTLYDGSYHDVDSSEMAFKIAGSMAFRTGALNADPTLLEPVMKVEVVTPEDYLGDVMGDLNRRRGITHGMDDSPTGKVIQAEVPLAEMFGYATDLRSATQGRATYSMEFEKYSEAPTNIADAVIRKAS